MHCIFCWQISVSSAIVFSSSHVWMWELDHKEGWVPKYWCFWIVVLTKTLESLLDSKEIKQVNPKGNQPWIFTGRTDAETPIFWLPDMKSFHWRRSWCWERLKAKEEGSRGWDGSIASLIQWTLIWQTLRDSEEQGSLVRCSPWDRKESDTTSTEQQQTSSVGPFISHFAVKEMEI